MSKNNMHDIETILTNNNVNPAEGPTRQEGILLTEMAICQQKKLGRASIDAIHEARAAGEELDESHELVISMRAIHSTLQDWRLQRKRLRMYERYGLDLSGYLIPQYGTTPYYRRYGYPGASEETVNGRNHI